ncbi:MAG TPA: hypothetical protein VFS67_18600 [Polyangiaceae bacterium]|nr:hypothetical protein [Polyangiaceae bacterium]
MRRGRLSLGAAVLLCVALWAFWPRPEPDRSAEAQAKASTSALEPAPASPSAPAPTGSGAAGADAAGRSSLLASGRKAARQPSAEQQRLRERVVRSLRERGARVGAPAAGAAAPAASAQDSARAPREGTMKDKTGVMGDEVKVINRELMPMVDECVQAAHERDARLHGMLALSVKLASAEGVGSILEAVEPTDRNEVHDPELIDCVRQSAFSISLPMPKADSLQQILLTIPIEAAAGAGARSPS